MNSEEDWTECYIPSKDGRLLRATGLRTKSRIESTLCEAGGLGRMRRLPRLERVRWREPCVTKLILTVTYILYKGIRRGGRMESKTRDRKDQ